tara:strand:+ start:2772 stop:2978 length:207 start_codon:yes stop_codon:yes gene_type:complete
MNLLLRPLENNNDPVWSVIISLIILLSGVTYYIYTLMDMAFEELKDVESDQPEGCGPGSTDSTPGTSH